MVGKKIIIFYIKIHKNTGQLKKTIPILCTTVTPSSKMKSLRIGHKVNTRYAPIIPITFLRDFHSKLTTKKNKHFAPIIVTTFLTKKCSKI